MYAHSKAFCFQNRMLKFVKIVVMTDLALKYNLLDSSSKREVQDFMDFLLTRETKQKKTAKSDYKKKILKVSVWSDSDIDLIIQNQQKFSQWKAQDW
jgi:hypothetical protein